MSLFNMVTRRVKKLLAWFLAFLVIALVLVGAFALAMGFQG